MNAHVGRLSATVQGSGARTIVLANGFCTSKATWSALVAGLPLGSWRLIRFDYVGTTAATLEHWHAQRYGTLHGHADDVVGLLHALDVRDATFVGHSMSAMVGALTHVVAPELVSRLVLIGGSPRYLDDGDYRGGFSANDVSALLDAAAADLGAWIAGFAPQALGRGAAPEHINDYADHLLRMRPDVALTMMRSIFLSDYRHVLPRVACPVDIIQSAHDVAVPREVAEYLARTLSDAHLHLLPCEGHLPHLTHPDLVLPPVLRALGTSV